MSFLEQFFKNFELKMHTAVVQRLYWDTEGPKQGPKHGLRTAKPPNIRSLQQCNWESEADMTYVAVIECHFWRKFLKNFD